MDDIEKRVIGKVMTRLIPFLILCYFVAYLDRVNVGFAKLHMNQALGLSEAAFGLGAGLFFVGYFLFEVPSNIFLEKVGARVWIARIMITWGIVSPSSHRYRQRPEFRRRVFSIRSVCCSAPARPASFRASSSI
jgi:ACS family tartrate transporter-like MFS transporter